MWMAAGIWHKKVMVSQAASMQNDRSIHHHDGGIHSQYSLNQSIQYFAYTKKEQGSWIR
jgi:hypothetical protein